MQKGMRGRLAKVFLGPPVVQALPFFWEGSPAKIDYIKKVTLILTSLLEDLEGTNMTTNDVGASPLF